MRDVSAKIKTLRVATAKATLVVSPETIGRIQAQDIPKGDPLPVAKVAAIQAAKNCSQIIPYCHPLPIDYVGVEFNLTEAAIEISVTIKAVYKTGVEMEALTAASVAALTIYDMTKMLDEAMVLKEVVLVSKTGGKSDFKERSRHPLQVGVLVFSDTVAQGVKEDRSGKLIQERLQAINTPECPLHSAAYQVVSDSPEEIEKALLHFSDTLHLDLV
ncbi:MAG: cyclic pyranopterin monophosphate synthase MoaC, partial [Cyanobacteria bacterium]|nr:cyclic pyranopterin monophosphate synthase MoaC [Cyanobacteriota bacterium]